MVGQPLTHTSPRSRLRVGPRTHQTLPRQDRGANADGGAGGGRSWGGSDHNGNGYVASSSSPRSSPRSSVDPPASADPSTLEQSASTVGLDNTADSASSSDLGSTVSTTPSAGVAATSVQSSPADTQVALAAAETSSEVATAQTTEYQLQSVDSSAAPQSTSTSASDMDWATSSLAFETATISDTTTPSPTPITSYSSASDTWTSFSENYVDTDTQWAASSSSDVWSDSQQWSTTTVDNWSSSTSSDNWNSVASSSAIWSSSSDAASSSWVDSWSSSSVTVDSSSAASSTIASTTAATIASTIVASAVSLSSSSQLASSSSVETLVVAGTTTSGSSAGTAASTAHSSTSSTDNTALAAVGVGGTTSPVSTAGIIGIAIAVVVAIMVCIVLAIWLYRRKQKDEPDFGTFYNKSDHLKRSGTTATKHSALDFSDDPVSPRSGWRHMSMRLSRGNRPANGAAKQFTTSGDYNRQSHLTVAGPGMAGRGAHHTRRVSEAPSEVPSLLSMYGSDDDAHSPVVRVVDDNDMRNSSHDNWATYNSFSRTMPGSPAPPPPVGAPNLPPTPTRKNSGGPQVVSPVGQSLVYDAYSQPTIQRLPWARATPPPVPAIPRQFTEPSRGILGRAE